MELYNEYDQTTFSSFSEALDYYFTKEVKLIKKELPHEKQINELKRIIEEQKVNMENLRNKETANRKKAEVIYNNYNTLKEILDEINKASKKHSWQEIKKKLKGHKLVKDVDIIEKRVVVDIET